MSSQNSSSPLPEALRDEYPFHPQRLALPGGWEYSYLDEGQGPPVLFVHGNPTWSFAWRNFIKDLCSDYRCVAPDHLGMGLSDKPQDFEYRIDQHIDNLCTLISKLDLREITLVGHDWGGCIGMGAAARMPERFSRFVMMNTAAFRSQAIPRRIAVCRWPVLGPMAVQGFNAFAQAAQTMAISHQERITPEIRAGYLYPYDSWQHRLAVQRFVEEIPLDPSHPTYPTLVEVETGLAGFQSHPMLLIWGEQDWCFTTEFLDEWEQRFPNARVLRFSDAGHYVFEDAWERMLPVLREFLEETPSRRRSPVVPGDIAAS